MSPATATSIRKRWPSLRYQMSGRVWMAACGMGSNTRSVTHACTQGPRSGQIACHDLQVELVGCRHELSKHRSDVSDKSVMPGDVVGWVVPVDRARRACRWLDRVICCSAAERAAVRGRRGLEALNYEQPRCPLHRPQDAGRHVELQLAVPACAQWPGIAGRQARRHRVCGHGRARHAAQAGPTWIGHCLHESYTTSALASDDATTRKTQTFGRIG